MDMWIVSILRCIRCDGLPMHRKNIGDKWKCLGRYSLTCLRCFFFVRGDVPEMMRMEILLRW